MLSHIMQEVESICDKVVIINNGIEDDKILDEFKESESEKNSRYKRREFDKKNPINVLEKLFQKQKLKGRSSMGI